MVQKSLTEAEYKALLNDEITLTLREKLNSYLFKERKATEFRINFNTFKRVCTFLDLFRPETSKKILETGLYGYYADVPIYIDKALEDDVLEVLLSSEDNIIIDLREDDEEATSIVEKQHDILGALEEINSLSIVGKVIPTLQNEHVFVLFDEQLQIDLGEIRFYGDENESIKRVLKTVVFNSKEDFEKQWQKCKSHTTKPFEKLEVTVEDLISGEKLYSYTICFSCFDCRLIYQWVYKTKEKDILPNLPKDFIFGEIKISQDQNF